MEIISKQGDPSLALVYVARFRGQSDLLAEFVDARDPQVPMDKKWVVIISTQFGCPIECPMCDAGGDFKGNLTAKEMLAQIEDVISKHGVERLKNVDKFKIQFARMGEPALNPEVLVLLRMLPSLYNTPALIPCIATTAPSVSIDWLMELKRLRHDIYKDLDFQLQLSINSTNEDTRDRLMPAPKLTLKKLGRYASNFHMEGKRKVALNFALAENIPVDANIIAENFNPAHTIVKLTPLNPTNRSIETGLQTALPPDKPEHVNELCNKLACLGFETIVSIGDVRENIIGSNCGMAVKNMRTQGVNHQAPCFLQTFAKA